MSLRSVGIVLLLIGSLAIGVTFGELSFRLFLATVPPVALSAFNQNSAHAAFWLYGLAAGLAIFAWVLLALLLSPLFRKRQRAAGAPGAPSLPPAPPAPGN